jgi:phospholipid transport system substrate-binding protein
MQVSYSANSRCQYLTKRIPSSFSLNARAACAGQGSPGSNALRLVAALIAMLLFASFMATPSMAASATNGAEAGSPTALVKSVIDQTSAIVRDTSISTAERNRKLRGVAEANFDFSDMARTSLGYHWRQITPQQRAKFVPLFTSFMEAVYLNKMQNYGVENVRADINSANVTFTGQEFEGADYAEVHSKAFFRNHPHPVNVNYLLKRVDLSWKIYDLEIDAISVMANYRNQFNRVINNNGYPELITLLKKKTQELDKTLGK